MTVSIELLKYILIFAPMILVAFVSYVSLLLGIARALSGVPKLLVGLVIYLVFSLVFVSPLFYLVAQYREVINESISVLLKIMASYAVIVAPGLVYLVKFKIRALRNAGYFLPRR